MWEKFSPRVISVATYLVLLSILSVLLISCGGGGGGDDGSPPPPDKEVGPVRVRIDDTLAQVGTPTMDLTGDLSISSYSCDNCPRLGPGMSVSWTNVTSGDSGVARHSFGTYQDIVFGCSCRGRWGADVPLDYGDNQIKIRLELDTGGYWSDEIIINRNPGFPEVVAFSPADDAVDIAVNRQISVTFSEAIDPGSITPSSFSLVYGDNILVNGVVTYSGMTATFIPDNYLHYATTYTVRVSYNATDLDGNQIGINSVSYFTTGAMPDQTAPTVVSAAPANLSGVDVDILISAIFSEAISPGTINNSTFLLTKDQNQTVSGTVLYTDSTATFSPLEPLEYLTNYTATITTGVSDLAGNGLASEYNWSFSTLNAQTTAELIENLGLIAGCPAVAVDASGNATAVWAQGVDYNSEDAWANRFVLGTGWETAEQIDISSADIWGCPDIGVDSNGDAIAIWSQAGVLTARHFDSVNGWGTPVTIGGSGALYPDIVVSNGGNAMVVWENSRSIYASYYDTLNGWGSPQLLETGSGEASQPKVILDSNGNAIAVWVQANGFNQRVMANRYKAGIGWGVEEAISTGTDPYVSNSDVALSGNSAGDVFAAWSQGDTVSALIWSNHYSPSSGWGSAVPIEQEKNYIASGAYVATDEDGNATAVWTRGDNNKGFEIASNHYIKGVGWNNLSTTLGAAEGWSYPRVAISPSGKTSAIWQWSNKVVLRQNIPAMGWGALKLLNTAFGEADLLNLVADGSENLIAVWSQGDGTGINDIWADRFQ